MADQDSGTIVAERGRLQAGQRGLSVASALGVALFTAAVSNGQVPALLLVCWLLSSLVVLAASYMASHALEGARPGDAAAVERLQQLGAALCGLASGAAASLFLALLDPPTRLAITVAACAGLCVAIVEFGRHGSPFRLQTACCVGQFALAWWRLDEPGSGLLAASLAGFGLLAALASSSVDRLAGRVLAMSLENRRLAESLAVEHGRALAADRAKTHFVAAASHDLRQPAAALSLMTNLLREQVKDPALAPLVTGLQRSVNSMNDLLGQLLDLSRLDTGRIAVGTERVDVDALLDALAGELAPQAAERGIRVQVARCGHTLDCDPVLVTRMLRNLADNALRHTREGVITLAAEAGSSLRLSVADTGTGIAIEHQQRIFEEHYQVGNASRQRTQGLGLGLAIVKRIAALHSVAIRLESSPGRGSRFILDFGSADHRPLPDAQGESNVWAESHPHGEPCAGGETAICARAVPGPEPEPVPGPGQEAPPARFAGRRVLLVEDDEALAVAFLAWLRAAGFEALHAADGHEAVRMLHAGPALDLVVSDFRLPGECDGLEVLRQANLWHPRASRLLVSGDIDPALAGQARDQGVPMLRKPLDPVQLKAVLEAALLPLG
jgi:signal transduction histidine kinase